MPQPNHNKMKKILALAFSLLFCAASAQNLEDGMVLYYPMNGNCLDSSGNNFHGTTNAVLTTDHFGVNNRAYHFNGVNQYINWPADTLLHPSLPVSFAFWVKFDNASSEDGAIFTNDYKENKYTGIYCGLTSQKKFIISVGDGGSISPATRRSLIGNSVAVSGVWYYVIGIINGLSNMQLVINCANEGGTYDGSGGAMSYSGSPGTLGRYDADNSLPPYYLEGSLDDFRLWNRALTYSNIDELCKINGVNESSGLHNLIALYPNPVNEKLYLLNVPEEVKKIEVYTMTGIRLLSDVVCAEVDVRNLTSGYYFVHFLDSEGCIIAVKKFIRQ